MAVHHRLGTWYLNEKGYPRFCGGVHRGRYVHRVLMAEHLGRALTNDEDVHHENGDKLDFRIVNLKVLGHAEHGWLSAAQHWWMGQLDIKSEKEWNEFFDSQGEDNARIP